MPNTASSSLGDSASTAAGSVASPPTSSRAVTSKTYSHAACPADAEREPCRQPAWPLWVGIEVVTAPLYLASVLPGFESQEDAAQTWRVGELGAHLERLLAGAFPGDVWVEGQIRDLSRPASGHVFFQLAEPAPHGQPPTATIAVVLRRSEKVFVNNLLRRSGGAVRMDDGIEVRIKARVR